MAEHDRVPFHAIIAGEHPGTNAALLPLADLGSGLIDQSQKMTVAAMTMADMKVWAHRS